MAKQGIRIILLSSAYLLVCALAYLGFRTYKSNLLGWYLIFIALSYGLGGPYLLRSNLKEEKVVRREKQDRSFWLILPGFLVVYGAAPLEYLHLPQILPRTTWMQIVGLILITASLVLFIWAAVSLKGFYSGRIWVKADHILVQHGPYHILRHPAYTSYIITSLGIAVGFSSLICLLAIPLLLIPGLIYRLNIEEEILRLEFGEQYETYARSTKRLVPYIW